MLSIILCGCVVVHMSVLAFVSQCLVLGVSLCVCVFVFVDDD